METFELVARGPADEPDDASRVSEGVPRLAEPQWESTAAHDGAAPAAAEAAASSETHPAAEAHAETPVSTEPTAESPHKSIAEIASALRGAAESGRRVSVVGMADDIGTTST